MAPTPTEQKSVQDRILLYAGEVGWNYVSRADAEKRRSFNDTQTEIRERARNASFFFDDLLYERVKSFNPKYNHSKPELIRTLSLLPSGIQGNRGFLAYLRGEKTFFQQEEGREYNLKLIDFDDYSRNIYETTEEYYYFNGRYGNREDIVFLINGIPVLVIECKNATKEEAIAIGVDQLRRYHSETPEMMVPQQMFTATESIGFAYGVTWNTNRRSIFDWKHDEIGKLEAKIKSFCDISHILPLIKNYIIFAEQNEELNKYILRQHQTEAVEKVVERSLEAAKTRGLVWHTQGSGKTFTMITAAEMLFKAPKSEKPTILLMIDRNELEDQLIRNLESLGIENVTRAKSIAELNRLLRDDYRGLVVTMIHKFKDMPADLNLRKNIYVLVDEAHRTTQGELGNYLMAAIPKASFIGFTGTPIDKTVYGKGTFKTFGIDDDKGYLHKYSIADSIKDGTTLPLYYALAPNELRVPTELLEKEFLDLAEAQGVSDIGELNKILERAVNLRVFLKGEKRVDAIARCVADHYTQNVEPIGYKAFLVGVDREACAMYKKALDKYLPPEYSEVVYTGNYNDNLLLKEFHLSDEKEKKIRKDFVKPDSLPKILIVTQKLLTGYDAGCLYAMYLDKPMRDHTLLQAIARVNRPFEEEGKETKKPHGFVLDFVGIFDKLEKALAFDSEEVDAVIRDIHLLKMLFKTRMETVAPDYITLVSEPFTDKDTDNLIEHFKDKSIRKEFFKFFKELEMLYEIISPDAFLRPYIDGYKTLSAIYAIVRNAYAKRVYVDRELQRKTEQLVKGYVNSGVLEQVNEFFEINEDTLEKIKETHRDINVRVINLVKSIEKHAEENSDDLFLLSMKEIARQVQERFEDNQINTKEALADLARLYGEEIRRRKEQANKGLDGLTFFVYRSLLDKKFKNADTIADGIKKAFLKYTNWKKSEKELRDLRQEVYYAIFAVEDDLDKIVDFVDYLFNLLFKAFDL